MVQSKNTYCQLADAELQVICMHHVTSLRPITHEGIFPPLQAKQLASFNLIASQYNCSSTRVVHLSHV
jgi:hypothetical protein